MQNAFPKNHLGGLVDFIPENRAQLIYIYKQGNSVGNLCNNNVYLLLTSIFIIHSL